MMISMRRLTSAWNSYVSSPSRFWRALPRKAFRQPGRLQEGQRRDGHALRIFAVVGLEADYSLRELGQTGCMHRQMASRHNGRRRRVHRSACLGANCQRQRDKYTEHRRTYVYDPLQGCSLQLAEQPGCPSPGLSFRKKFIGRMIAILMHSMAKKQRTVNSNG
jgi:hypothetical protein